MNIQTLLLVANGLLSTTYGYNEKMCGPPEEPTACTKGAITSTGTIFDPDVPMVAIAAPEDVKFQVIEIGLRTKFGACQKVLLSDKMNSRYFGVRGFDITPAALKLLTGKAPDPKWSDKLYLCNIKGKKQ